MFSSLVLHMSPCKVINDNNYSTSSRPSSLRKSSSYSTWVSSMSPTPLPTSPTSTLTVPMSTISPPGSPPSPTMSMNSLEDLPLKLDLLKLADADHKIKVMIVDDNDINLSILSRMLQHHFADSVEISAVMTSGVEALERLGKEEFDLILMDIDMPELTGVETTAAIRQATPEHPILEVNQQVPIIAVTTSDGAAQREVYQQVGMCDCVSKPIALPKLRCAIEGAIRSTGRIAAG